MKRILFVDDESKILDGIRRLLHADRQHWDLQFAVGGEAALKACEAGPFDVVISDRARRASFFRDIPTAAYRPARYRWPIASFRNRAMERSCGR